MRARGAALRQLAWLVLRPSAVIAVVAGAAAAVLAISLTPGQQQPPGLVAGWRHDRGDAGRTRADQRAPATGGGAGHRQAGAPGQRADPRGPADRSRGGAGRRFDRRAHRAAQPGPVRREHGPVPERGAGARRHPGGRHRAALLPTRRPRTGPDRRPVARGGRVRRPGPGHPHPARRRLAGVRPGAGAQHGGVRRHDQHVGHPRPGGRILAAGRRRRGHRSAQRADVPAGAAAPDRRDCRGFPPPLPGWSTARR